MPQILLVIIATLVVSLISVVGIVVLFLKEKLLSQLLLFLVALAAGALTGVAFLDLFPQAILEALSRGIAIKNVFLYGLLGFCAFFVLEYFLSWHHHHAKEHPEAMPFSYLILISDGFHNFLDGLAIAGSFAASLQLGIAATLGVILHEVPQEIGDFAVLVYGGFNRVKALFLNFVSAVTVVLGGILGFLILERISDFMLFLLSFAAGSFIYIAASDLMPEIRKKGSATQSLAYFSVFLFGIGMVALLGLII